MPWVERLTTRCGLKARETEGRAFEGHGCEAGQALAALQAARAGALFPRASAFGLSPGLGSPGPLGRWGGLPNAPPAMSLDSKVCHDGHAGCPGRCPMNWKVAEAKQRFSEVIRAGEERKGRTSVADAFAELCRICGEESYELETSERRNRPNPFPDSLQPYPL
jgi:hypothetical protein